MVGGEESDYQGQRVGSYLHEGHPVGRYLVGKPLGEGGMGQVYEGTDLHLGRRVAIKFLFLKHAGNRALVARFVLEAQAACAIEHPGIVQVSDAGQHDDGAPYLVMELLRGESLRSRLARREADPLSFERIRGIAKQVADALAATHAKGIVHRDLKPENIFLVPDPRMHDAVAVKILDFGIAKLADDIRGHQEAMTAPGAVMGTPQYMSPEQILDAAAVDHRTDIYALGIILYEMICGAPPFTGKYPEMFADHLRKKPLSPLVLAPDAPPDLEGIVLRCLEKAPDARFASMVALMRALDPSASAPIVPTLVARDGSTLVAPDVPEGVAPFSGETKHLSQDRDNVIAERAVGGVGTLAKTAILVEGQGDERAQTDVGRGEDGESAPVSLPRSSGAANGSDEASSWRWRSARVIAGAAGAVAVTALTLIFARTPSPATPAPSGGAALQGDLPARLEPSQEQPAGTSGQVEFAHPPIAPTVSSEAVSRRATSALASKRRAGRGAKTPAVESAVSTRPPPGTRVSNEDAPLAPERRDDPQRMKPFE